MSFQPPELWDAQKIAGYIGVSAKTVLNHRIHQQGFPKPIKRGRRLLWDARETVRWLTRPIGTPQSEYSTGDSVEEQTSLYRHFDADQVLLYVGISLRPIQRLAQHEGASHWFQNIARIEIEKFPSRSDALQAEAEAIWRERPKHNVAMPNRGRAE